MRVDVDVLCMLFQPHERAVKLEVLDYQMIGVFISIESHIQGDVWSSSNIVRRVVGEFNNFILVVFYTGNSRNELSKILEKNRHSVEKNRIGFA